MFISDSYLISCREVVDKFIVQQFIMAVTAPLQYKARQTLTKKTQLNQQKTTWCIIRKVHNRKFSAFLI